MSSSFETIIKSFDLHIAIAAKNINNENIANASSKFPDSTINVDIETPTGIGIIQIAKNIDSKEFRKGDGVAEQRIFVVLILYMTAPAPDKKSPRNKIIILFNIKIDNNPIATIQILKIVVNLTPILLFNF